MSSRWYFSSESVTEGHPDKVADAISDAVLDDVLAHDPLGRVACETLVTTGRAVVAGELNTRHRPDFEDIARRTIRDLGYVDDDYFRADDVEILVFAHTQSPDIAQGVDRGDIEAWGAGDQGIMFGFAVDETTELMPFPIQMAHRLAERLAEVRKLGILDFLLPDGKTQVTVEYEGGKPKRVTSILVSAHHKKDMDSDMMAKAVWDEVVVPTVPDGMLSDDARYFFNPTGKFEIGGPHADTGLTGRKIIVDTYGGYARHGGGAFSGKDPSKVDRTAAYGARWAAKNIVAAGLASRCELQLAYAIGTPEPFSVHVDTFGTSAVDPGKLTALVKEYFDFRPGAIIKRLDLLRPIYRPTAAYGHFGRPGSADQFPWESTDVADDLRRAAESL
ncbi:MAG TPA: methionine adenosyltransferase [Acidimicrobiia bacterium]|mgnify:FL=1|nr:methionine adenosyltransferase [Acidimicrobiia bacterium]